MRILYHHRTLGRGAEGIHIKEMVDAFRHIGHDVEVCAFVGSPSAAHSGRASLVGAIRQRLPRAAYEFLQLMQSLASVGSVGARIARFKPDIIYKRHARYDYGPILAARRHGVPLFLEVNCVYSSPRLRQFEPVVMPALLRRLEHAIFSSATMVLPVSQALASEVRDVAQHVRCVVLPNGANLRRFRPDCDDFSMPALPAAAGKLVIGFVGTLWKWHGLDLLLEAVRKLQRRDVCLVIVGDGQMRTQLMARCEEWGFEREVVFTGEVPHELIPRYLKMMDIAVLPADLRFHASPMKLIEYMAMAKAIVAPKIANIEELVQHDEEALLFTPGDVDSLVSCLTRLLESPPLRARLGRAARRKVEIDLNWEANARRVIALYESWRRASE